MSLYPVRSISQLPALSANINGNISCQGETIDLKNPYKDVDIPNLQNYKAYTYTDKDQNQDDFDNEYQWITDIPDGRIYIETSLSTYDGYISRKFDFGNLLRYIGEQFEILNARSFPKYLTKKEADELYLPLIGGELSGSLVINPNQENGGYDKAEAALVIYNKEDELQNIQVINNASSLSTIITETAIKCTDVFAHNINCTYLTADSISANNQISTAYLYAATDFNFAGIITKDDDFANITKLKSEEISVYLGSNSSGTTTTDYLVVKEDTTFKKDVTVGKDLIVNNNISATTGKDDVYNVFLKGVHVLGDQVLSADTGVSTDRGIITGDIIRGLTKIQIGDNNNNPTVYATSDGFTCTSHFCNLTAQYACWA